MVISETKVIKEDTHWNATHIMCEFSASSLGDYCIQVEPNVTLTIENSWVEGFGSKCINIRGGALNLNMVTMDKCNGGIRAEESRIFFNYTMLYGSEGDVGVGLYSGSILLNNYSYFMTNSFQSAVLSSIDSEFDLRKATFMSNEIGVGVIISSDSSGIIDGSSFYGNTGGPDFIHQCSNEGRTLILSNNIKLQDIADNGGCKVIT